MIHLEEYTGVQLKNSIAKIIKKKINLVIKLPLSFTGHFSFWFIWESDNDPHPSVNSRRQRQN